MQRVTTLSITCVSLCFTIICVQLCFGWSVCVCVWCHKLKQRRGPSNSCQVRKACAKWRWIFRSKEAEKPKHSAKPEPQGCTCFRFLSSCKETLFLDLECWLGVRKLEQRAYFTSLLHAEGCKSQSTSSAVIPSKPESNAWVKPPD